MTAPLPPWPACCAGCGAPFGYGPGEVRRLVTVERADGEARSWCGPCDRVNTARYRRDLARRVRS